MEGVGAACSSISICAQIVIHGWVITFEDVRTLQVQVGAVASCVVDVPHAIEVMKFGL